MTRALKRLRCRFGRHDWTTTIVDRDGKAAVIEHCVTCRKIDVDGIRFVAWNRKLRRAASRR